MQANDGQLLASFLQNRDERAFEELIKRHAGMVMAVCRRVLGDVRDAEEAFQNTFLVLIRKVRMHLRAESIGGWLYNVAARTALDIRGRRLTHAVRFVEQEKIEMISRTEEISAAWEAMKGLLDEELVQLADKYRRPLILCYLEGKPTDQAAFELGVNHNTLRIRLMRGRELLRKRLVRRGVTVSIGLLSTVLDEQVAQSAEVVSEVLIQSTVQAAVKLFPAIAAVGTGAMAMFKMQLMKGAVAVMTTKTTALVIAGLVLLGLVGSTLYLNKPGQKSVQVQEGKLPPRKHNKSSAISSNVNLASETIPVQAGVIEKATIQKKIPASVQDYYKHFKEAMEAQGNERWRILRELGIDLTDTEFEAAWQKAQSDTRFKGLKHLMGLPEFNGGDAALFLKLQDAIFSQWVANDPLAAIEWAKNLPEAKYYYVSFDKEGILPGMITDSREGFITALVALWARNDMDTATKWANGQSIGMDRQTAQLGIAIAMSVKDAKASMELVAKENLLNKQGGKIVSEISYILSNWALSNPVEAVNYLMALPSGKFDDIHVILKNDWGMSAVGYQWAKTDLKGALDWAEKLSTAEKSMFMAGVTREWAKEDFTAAKDYVTSMWESQAGEGNCNMLFELANTWVEKDPQACAEWAMQLSDKGVKQNPNSGNLCKFICQQWANKDHTAAFDWIEQLPESELKKEMWNAAAGGMIDGMCVNNELSSFEEGINLIDKTFPEKKDTKKWLYWHMISMWEQSDPAADNEITDWIKTLPVGKDKDYLLSRFCRNQNYVQRTSCPDLIQLASSMQDEKDRQNIYESIFNRWIREDPAVAKQWLQNSSLPQSVKDKWLAGK